MPYDRHGAGDRGAIGVTVMASIVDSEEDGGGREVDILDGEFFDDEMLVLVYRMTGTQGEEHVSHPFLARWLMRKTSRSDVHRYGELRDDGLRHGGIRKVRKVPRAERYDCECGGEMERGACKSHVVAMFLARPSCRRLWC